MDGRSPEKQLANSFNIDVLPIDQVPEYLPPLVFLNRPDFPDDQFTPMPYSNPVKNVSLGRANIGRANKKVEWWEVFTVQAQPAVSLSLPEEITKNDVWQPLLEMAGSRALIYSAIFLAKYGDKIQVTRRQFLRLLTLAPIGLAGAGILKLLGFAALAASNEGNDAAAYLYQTQAQISSARAIILMDDLWQRYPQLRQGPVLALSQSHFDGLEPMVRNHPDPAELKHWLLFADDLHPALKAGIEAAGSPERFFSLECREFSLGNPEGTSYTDVIKDQKFLNDMRLKLGYPEYQEPLPGSKQA